METKTDETVVEEATTEETAPEENTEETTSQETEESTAEESTDDGVDWKERALKAERAIEKSKKKAKESKTDDKSQSNDEVTLSRLEVRGVMEPEDQQYVLRFAAAEGISPIEALSDEIVQDRLKSNERKRNSVNATPRSNNRATSEQDKVDMWVRKFNKTGELPDNDPVLTNKILTALKNGA